MREQQKSVGITSSVKILVFIEKDIGKWVEVRFRAGLWNGVDILYFIWTLKELGRKKMYAVLLHSMFDLCYFLN